MLKSSEYDDIKMLLNIEDIIEEYYQDIEINYLSNKKKNLDKIIEELKKYIRIENNIFNRLFTSKEKTLEIEKYLMNEHILVLNEKSFKEIRIKEIISAAKTKYFDLTMANDISTEAKKFYEELEEQNSKSIISEVTQISSYIMEDIYKLTIYYLSELLNQEQNIDKRKLIIEEIIKTLNKNKNVEAEIINDNFNLNRNVLLYSEYYLKELNPLLSKIMYTISIKTMLSRTLNKITNSSPSLYTRSLFKSCWYLLREDSKKEFLQIIKLMNEHEIIEEDIEKAEKGSDKVYILKKISRN